MNLRSICTLVVLTVSMSVAALAQTRGTAYDYGKIRRERLGRGFVAVRQPGDSVLLSWRFLSSDADDAVFDLYRDGRRINPHPVADVTWYKERYDGDVAVRYELHDAATGRMLDTVTLSSGAPVGYLEIPLDVPDGGVTPAGETYTYTANDASVGDVDGDGWFEIILKWNPSNAHDNAHDGYTGPVYMDCYRLTGERLWRIDLGRNIRAGAHYTQFIVYDLDGDGRAEVVMKTADGTVDGCGKVIGDGSKDYRERGIEHHPKGSWRNRGRIFRGAEYLTVFDGRTGAALQTIDYIPERGDLLRWGDDRANRSDRFLATVAYLDGIRPSVVMCRGYYARTVLAAFDWDGRTLRTRWIFDSDDAGNEGYGGQGNHNLRTADVDGDGRDEIIYGQMAVDHDGKGLYTTGMYHGDAMHVTAFIPNDDRLQLWGCHENGRDGTSFRDAATGEVFWQVPQPFDVGRCMAADIDPTNYGLEMWSSTPGSRRAEEGSGGVRNYRGEVVNPDQSTLSINSAVWWTGDLNRELLDRNVITKYNPATRKCEPIFLMEGCAANNGSKEPMSACRATCWATGARRS